MSDTQQIQLRIVLPNQSLYLSRLNIDINVCINHLNRIDLLNEFSKKYKIEYEYFQRECGINNIRPEDEGDLKEIYKMIFTKIYDSFIMYLKHLIIAAEVKNNTLTKNRKRQISQYRFEKIVDSLHELKIVPNNQPQWDALREIKKYRDKITHEHELENLIHTLHFQKLPNKNYSVNTDSLSKTIDFIRAYSKIIDQEFTESNPKFFTNI